MIRYPLLLAPDDGILLVTCPDLPEVANWGLDEEHACFMGARAVEEAVAGRLMDVVPVPRPGEGAEPDEEPGTDCGTDSGALPALLCLSAPLDQDTTTTALLLHWLGKENRQEGPQGQGTLADPVGRAGVRGPLRLDLGVPPGPPGRAQPHQSRPARRRSARR